MTPPTYSHSKTESGGLVRAASQKCSGNGSAGSAIPEAALISIVCSGYVQVAVFSGALRHFRVSKKVNKPAKSHQHKSKTKATKSTETETNNPQTVCPLDELARSQKPKSSSRTNNNKQNHPQKQ